jgi:RNA polymerase sigma factor (sigma-70 family)
MGVGGELTPDPREVLRRDREGASAEGKHFIAKNLLGYCIKRTRERARAADAAQEAIALVLAGKGWHRWVYDGEGSHALSLLNHLSDVARDWLNTQRERAAHWRELAESPARDRQIADPQARTDERIEDLEEHDDEMRLAQAVMDRLDERTREMLRLEQQGEHDAAALADRLGCTVKDIYRARERVKYHRDAVLEEDARRRRGEP